MITLKQTIASALSGLFATAMAQASPILDTVHGGVSVIGAATAAVARLPHLAVIPVPEPMTLLFVATGLVGLAAVKRRQDQEQDDEV